MQVCWQEGLAGSWLGGWVVALVGASGEVVACAIIQLCAHARPCAPPKPEAHEDRRLGCAHGIGGAQRGIAAHRSTLALLRGAPRHARPLRAEGRQLRRAVLAPGR